MVNLQAELSYLQAHLTTLELPTPPPQPPTLLIPSTLSIADLPTSSPMPATYDLSSLFDPTLLQYPSWTHHQRPDPDTCHFSTTATRAPPDVNHSSAAVESGGDLRELFNRRAPPINAPDQASILPPHST